MAMLELYSKIKNIFLSFPKNYSQARPYDSGLLIKNLAPQTYIEVYEASHQHYQGNYDSSYGISPNCKKGAINNFNPLSPIIYKGDQVWKFVSNFVGDYLEIPMWIHP